MEWSTDSIIEFLELYEKEECLWHPTHPQNKSRKEITDAWLRIKNAMSVECTVEHLKKKKESLMGSFRGQMHKKKRYVMTTLGKRGEPFKSSWFAFANMDRFLGQFYVQEIDPQESKDGQDVEEVEYLIDIKPNNLSRSNSIDSEAESPNRSTSETHFIQAPELNPVSTRKDIKSTPELIAAVVGKKRMNEGYDFLKVFPEKSESQESQRDECELFGELLVKRIKRLDESLRDDVMNEIDNLVYRAGTKNRNKRNSFIP